MVRALIALALLAGCAPKPQTIPIAVRCVDPAQVPLRPRPLSDTPIPDSLEAASAVMLAKIAELFGYVEKAEPIMRACAR